MTVKTISTIPAAYPEVIFTDDPVVGVTNQPNLFNIEDKTFLNRFLILGVNRSMYKATNSSSTPAPADIERVKTLIRLQGVDTIKYAAEISQAGRAKNNDFALYVLALGISFGNLETINAVKTLLPSVARTSTHLFNFIAITRHYRGWGPALRKAVANWYISKSPDSLAYQITKYQQRNGWSHKDLLKLSHPNPFKGESALLRDQIFKYVIHGYDETADSVHQYLDAVEQIKTANLQTAISLIQTHGLPAEVVPNQFKNDAGIWNALMMSMGQTALIRNLNKLTQVGLLDEGSDATQFVVDRLTNRTSLERGRIHPLQMLIAHRTYSKGYSDKGSLVWTPNQDITDALEEGMYKSFSLVGPTGKSVMLNVDVSGSMNSTIPGTPISCREGAAIMAMVALRNEVESNVSIWGFDHKFRQLDISASDNLATVCKKTSSRSFGGTDASLPVNYALSSHMPVDCFSVYTDNEVNQNTRMVSSALQAYRKAMSKPNAKLVSIGMAVNDVSIADPNDSNMMDVAGFDSHVPTLIDSFINES